jgi:hypothetical protein
MVISDKVFHEANTRVALPSASRRSVRAAHFPSVTTTKMDKKVQLLKPLN